MKILKRAADAMKDKRSIYMARVIRRRGLTHPDLEAAIIKATSHDSSCIDYKNSHRVFAWARTSPSFLSPLLISLSKRLQKTRSWVVALKGLLLIHGVFCSKSPYLSRIGRLPFDLSSFHDTCIKSSLSWGLSAFVRAYFFFLDEKSCFLNEFSLERGSGFSGLGGESGFSGLERESGFSGLERERGISGGERENGVEGETEMETVLSKLQRSQALLDLLLQIRPYGNGMNQKLVLEAMDCVVIEIFDVYSNICNGVARVLIGIFEANKREAFFALKILKKASDQSTHLTSYFNISREMGVLNATEFPSVEKIPEQDIRDLEQIVYGFPIENSNVGFRDSNVEKGRVERERGRGEREKEKQLVVHNGYENHNVGLSTGPNLEHGKQERERQERERQEKQSKTIVTQKWVVFNDEFAHAPEMIQLGNGVTYGNYVLNAGNKGIKGDPFAASLNISPPLYSSNGGISNSMAWHGSGWNQRSFIIH
ncbi:putative clathrin assembly protein At1g25240 isoform X4 [Amborella trichopoda]|uniref:putative clathrin assembly protein At1g25240 isoform X4 n=1 Tax=Amborella trichopoda TaxID=13333 RepID=UPI0009BED104|nr:putative clathrin assembly protein At1g25240 isoform X4 [Amborella trichopoda]|eukprot:XP_020525988.1 putative clathrin assembly protein At1g25240 isoform X4 [Amborella trichopoda]